MSASNSAASRRPLLSRNEVAPAVSSVPNSNFYRDPSNVSAQNIKFKEVLEKDGEVPEQTLYELQIENPTLVRASNRTELASKGTLLTRRWQIIAISTITLLALAGGIGKLKFFTDTLNFK